MTPHRNDQYLTIISAMVPKDTGFSRLDVAQLLGIQKTVYVARLLDEMVAKGLLTRMNGSERKHKNTFVYFIARKGGKNV